MCNSPFRIIPLYFDSPVRNSSKSNVIIYNIGAIKRKNVRDVVLLDGFSNALEKLTCFRDIKCAILLFKVIPPVFNSPAIIVSKSKVII